MLARTRAGCLSGVEARAVDVEVHLGKGLPGFDLVGLPETAVRESRVRVRAALINQSFELPPRRVTLNLAPADLRKRGASLDLAIAIALLSAVGSCPPNRLEQTLLFGELSLSGELRCGRGLLPQLRSMQARGLERAIVPLEQLAEASLVDDVEVFGAHDLRSVVAYLAGERELARAQPEVISSLDPTCPDLRDVQGQGAAKRALEIAATGRHHILLIGPPGAGKTMLARRLPGILPRPSRAEALEIAAISSAAGLRQQGRPQRPFRAPHHTASTVALVGGGDPIRPGEVTLAHGGVLFLDELPEFGRAAIESFRTLMESGLAVVARARERVEMPAAPLVVAAMNPCPCGFSSDPTRLCTCSSSRVERYRSRVSGPILDRFDLHVALPPVAIRDLRAQPDEESSAVVRARVSAAGQRLGPRRGHRAPVAELLGALSADARQLALDASEALSLSTRGCAGALRVAATIAALDGEAAIGPAHVAEALSFRLLDRGVSRAADTEGFAGRTVRPASERTGR